MTMLAIQTALYDRLTDYEPLTELLASARDLAGDPLVSPAVYDHVPQPQSGRGDAWFPYVVIGEDTHNEWDTDTSEGFDTELEIHAWSRQRGRTELKEIQQAIYAALHTFPIEIEGVDTVLCHHEFAQAVLDPDGKTRHGIQRFRLITDNV